MCTNYIDLLGSYSGNNPIEYERHHVQYSNSKKIKIVTDYLMKSINKRDIMLGHNIWYYDYKNYIWKPILMANKILNSKGMLINQQS